jgi:hypothetical protein
MTETAGSDMLVAMVALNSPSLPEPSSILATLRERCPHCPAPSDLSQEGDTLVFHLGRLHGRNLVDASSNPVV